MTGRVCSSFRSVRVVCQNCVLRGSLPQHKTWAVHSRQAFSPAASPGILSMKNLAFHHLLRLKMIILPILTTGFSLWTRLHALPPITGTFNRPISSIPWPWPWQTGVTAVNWVGVFSHVKAPKRERRWVVWDTLVLHCTHEVLHEQPRDRLWS